MAAESRDIGNISRSQTERTFWKCEACGRHGHVEHEAQAGVVAVVKLLAMSHQRAQRGSDQCTFATDRVRVSTSSMQPMTSRECDMMRELLAHERMWVKHLAGRDERIPAARPMDLGGSNRSHHSATLRAMAVKGWVQDVGYGVSGHGRHGSRRVCKYKSTDAGRAALKAAEDAGEHIDEEMDDATRYAVRGDA